MRLGAIWLGVNRNLAPPEKYYILLNDAEARLLLEPKCELRQSADEDSDREYSHGHHRWRPRRRMDRPYRPRTDKLPTTDSTWHRPRWDCLHERHHWQTQRGGALPSQHTGTGCDVGCRPRIRARVTQGRLKLGPHHPRAICRSPAHCFGFAQAVRHPDSSWTESISAGVASLDQTRACQSRGFRRPDHSRMA